MLDVEPVTTGNIPQSKIPPMVRGCWQEWRKDTEYLRAVEDKRLAFYTGGDGQWEPEEIAARTADGRPWLTINCCKAAVDQVEGDVRKNPPGPKVLPVSGGADIDTAAIHAGLIRECEHRSNAQVAYLTAARYQGASGLGVIELATEYVNDRSDQQRCRIIAGENPAMYFWDPTAKQLGRQDAMWGGKIRALGEASYVEQYGSNRKILNKRKTGASQNASGWLQEMLGPEFSHWTNDGKGPYMVCEFYRVQIDHVKLYSCSDNVNRFDDDTLPKGIKRKNHLRTVPRRTMWKYCCDAVETLTDETQWLGTVIPFIPVLGQEVWRNGRLYRASLISEAMAPQRMLNYAATTCTEIIGLSPKVPYLGFTGQFKSEAWKTANRVPWAYLEAEPLPMVDPVSGQVTWAQLPQRQQMIAEVEGSLNAAAFAVDRIKAATNIYDPSLGNNKSDQSGFAIQQLRSESSTGTFYVSDNLNHAIQELYEQIVIINSQILTKAQVVSIVQPDSQHEQVTLNTLFGPDGIDKASGKKRKPVWLNSEQEHSIVVTVGTNYDVLKQQTSAILIDFMKIDPAILQTPGVAAKALRSISQGDPEIESIADLLDPSAGQNPAQMQQALTQAQQKIQAYELLITRMKQESDAKLPDLQTRRWIAAVQAAKDIEVAKVNASKDADAQAAGILASDLENKAGMAHEAAMQAVDQAHEKTMAAMGAANDAALAEQDAQHKSDQSAQDAVQTAALTPPEGDS